MIATKFGQVRGPTGEPRGVRRRPRVRARGLRGAHCARLGVESHRPLLPAPRRPEGADRGDGRRDGRAGRRGQGSLPRPVRGGGRRRSVAPTRCTRSPRCRASTRCGPASVEDEILPTVRELGIGFVAYSPARPRFSHGPFPAPRATSAGRLAPRPPALPGRELRPQSGPRRRVREIAADKGVEPGQLALAWVLHRGDDIVPIPGTGRREHLEENLAAAEIELGERTWRASTKRRRAGSPPETATRTCRRWRL